MNNVAQLRPRTFTANEELINSVREAIFASHIPYKALAIRTGVNHGTIARIASGYTKWPRPTTLFPLLDALGLELILRAK